jgi:3-hydroxybutyryl-CoA dehydratase
MNCVIFDDVAVGDRFGEDAVVTEWHLMTASALYNDAGPNHVNAVHAAENRFGARIAHGFLTTGIMMGVVGRHYGWSIEAFLESHVRFLRPVYVDERIDVAWEVTRTDHKPVFGGGGIVHLQGWCWAGRPERLAVELSAKLALNNTPAPGPHPPPEERSVRDGQSGPRPATPGR